MWSFLAVVIVVLVAVVLLRGSPTLARLEVRRGRVRLTRGRVPGRLFEDFEDVLADESLESAEVRIVVENGQPRLVVRGLDGGRQQQLRNVLGSYTVSQIRAGARTAGSR